MSSPKSKLRLICAFATLAVFAVASMSCRGFFVPEQLGSITISPATANVPLNGTLQLTAFGTNTDTSSAGNITGKLTWTSDSGAVTVSSGGLLTGTALTTSAATITGQYQGISATSSATVCAETATNFKLTLAQTTVTVGNDTTATVTAEVGGVSGVDVTAGVTWSTNNSGVTVSTGDPATVDTSGVTNNPTTVVITGVYSCNGVNSPSFSADLQVN
jgi:trimeric autotransporter adhesin